MTGQIWEKLAADWERIGGKHLRGMFEDAGRFESFSAEMDDLLIDFSKERLDEEALKNLLELAETSGVEARRADMFAGEPINTTEGREVLHVALRAQRSDRLTVDGGETADLVEPVLERFLSFADAVRSGDITASNGQRFSHVINIGIGGSDLGPVMVARALSPFRGDGPLVHFVSNVDGAHLADVTADCDPTTTLILVASKTFTTQETMTNAAAAKDWLATAIGEAGANQHLAALSTNLDATAAFGIDPDRVFGFWDWVGGRYSVWSAIGLSVALSVGSAHFRAFLDGARAMDRHFLTTPLAENLPVLLALIGIWRRNIMGAGTVAMIPYDQRLERLPAYVQQLDMESNGKGVELDGKPLTRASGPVIWGEAGTNAQHSFFQFIHQGTDIIPVDFIVAARSGSRYEDQHELLLANCLAQSEALAFGKTTEEVSAEMTAQGVAASEVARLAPHRTFTGNRPSTTILHRQLDPYTLGRLIALFEHKVFVQGTIWGVNSYDQWGVELGKALAKTLVPMVRGETDASGKDASTQGILARISQLQNE